MKYMKRILCVILTVAFVLSCTLTASAADMTLEEVTRYADALNHLELFLGTNNGYELESKLTREQAITMVVRLLGAEDEALEKNYSHPFTDVPNWAQPYVGYAYTKNITKGVSGTLFGAGQPVTENQFLTFLLRLLKYEDGVDFTWNEAEKLADQLGMQQEFATAKTGFIRGGAVILCWQFLNQKTQGSQRTIAEDLIEYDVFTRQAFAEAERISANMNHEHQGEYDEEETVTPPSGGGSEPTDPPSGGGSEPTDPPSGGGSEPTDPPSGGGSEPTDPPSGGGSEPTDPPSGGGSEPTDPPSGGGSEPTDPPSGGGSEPTDPPSGGGSEPTDPPSGGGSEPTDPPSGGGSEPTDPPSGGGSEPTDPPSGGGDDNETEDIPF